MAIPEIPIAKSDVTEDASLPPYKFSKTIEWEGVKVGYYSVLPGIMQDRVRTAHHIFVPFSGSVTIEESGEQETSIVHRRSAGEIGVAPAGTRFSAHWEEELEHVSILMSQEFLSRATVDFDENKNARIVRTYRPQDGLIYSIGQALATEIDSGHPAGRLYAESLVNTLAIHLLRHYSTDSIISDLNFGGLPAHKLRLVTEFLDANLERDLSLTEIADAVGLSQYHFARAFKKTTGQTPIQYLMRRRVDLAKQLLGRVDLSIAEISLRAGFKNQSHFTTLFRKFTTMTPKAFRDLARQ